MENESGYEAGSEHSPFTSDLSLSDSTAKQKKKPCEICGSTANELSIMTCFRCRETREHAYCARTILQRVPPIWLCEECRNSSPIVYLADQTANSRTNKVDNEDSIETAPSSRTNQVEKTVDNEDLIEAAPLSRRTNQVAENTISLPVVVPHVHMYTTSEESTPEESVPEDISSIVFKSMWERFNPPQITDLSSDSESEE